MRPRGKWPKIIVSATQVPPGGVHYINRVSSDPLNYAIIPVLAFDNLTLILVTGVDIVLVKSPHIYGVGCY